MTLSTSDLIKTVAETVFAVNGVKTAEASRQSFEKGKLAVEGVLSAIQQELVKRSRPKQQLQPQRRNNGLDPYETAAAGCLNPCLYPSNPESLAKPVNQRYFLGM